MPKTMTTDSRVIRQPSQITPYNGTGTIVPSSQQTRPFWFDGRFLAARDLKRDQDYFLLRQSELGTAAGFGVIHGLQVSMPANAPAAAETIVISAGQGLTPGGNLVILQQDLTVVLSDIADAEDLDAQFGVAASATPVARTRTGLFVIALRPVEFTANPVTSYPVSVQGTRRTHDGNIVEASAVSLVPYPDPTGNFDATTERAALARQIFLLGSVGPVSGSLLPLAIISLQRGVIEWVDPWLVRRDSGPEFSGLRFGLNNPSTQQAYFWQYDAQLRQIVAGLVQNKAPVTFAASQYFQALPPVGRFPLQSIDATAGTQLFFPPQTDVLLALVAMDELPALIEESLSLAPIDLTQPASTYADLALFALVPVPRLSFPNQPPAALKGALPQLNNNPKPLDLLRFYHGPTSIPPAENPWQQYIGAQTYGYYIRRRGIPIYISAATIAFIAVPGAAAGSFTLTASVSPETATGNVTFIDGSNVLATVALAQGSGSFAVAGLAAGPHQLTAAYSGDANYAAIYSAALEKTV